MPTAAATAARSAARRKQGGSDALSNLQALCFRGVQASYGHREAGFVFCALELITGRMVGIAEHVRNSMLGSGQRTDGDQILITNLSEAAA